MTTLREAATQALEAMEGGSDSWQLVGPAIDALKEALVEDAMQKFTDVSQEIEAALAEPVLQTCNCRWDGEMQMQQCTLHEAHVDAIKEWAQRAKFAEKKLAALAESVEPVAWIGYINGVANDLAFEPFDLDSDVKKPLFTVPPTLTDDQLDDIAVAARRGNLYDLRIAIEQAHGII